MTHAHLITLWQVLTVLAFVYAVRETVKLPKIASLLVDLVLLSFAYVVKRVRRRVRLTRLKFELAVVEYRLRKLRREVELESDHETQEH